MSSHFPPLWQGKPLFGIITVLASYFISYFLYAPLTVNKQVKNGNE